MWWWIILLIIIITLLPSSVEYFQTTNVKNIEIPESHVDNLYDLTKYMHTFFIKHNIPYWLIGGSLIGSLRNTPPGPIKWDDDLDVAILKRDEDKFIKALENDESFQKLVEWCPIFFGFQFKLKNKEKGYKDYYYDVFIYEERDGKFGKKLYTGQDTDFFEKYYYNDLNEIFPLKKCKFWDLALPCPNNLDTVHRGYDGNVLKFAQKYNHSTQNDDGNGGGGNGGCNVEKIDLTNQNINNGDTIPLLSKRLIKKLAFV